MVIGFDNFQPYIQREKANNELLQALGDSLIRAQLQKEHQSEPPSFGYNDLIDHLKKGNIALTPEAAPTCWNGE